MDSVIKTRSTCRLCDSHDVELALPIRSSPIGDAYITKDELSIKQDSYPLSLHLCKTCGHLQALDIIDPSILFKNYIYSTATSAGLVAHFNQYAKDVVAMLQCSTNSFVVEIGSNDGSLLKAFKSHGLRVLGIDPATNIAAQATANGLETLNTFFSFEVAKKIKATHGEAGIFAANNVFAHIDNIADVAQGVEHLLASDGVFVFEVSYLVDMVQKNVFDTIYHEHLSHHSVKPLQRFLKKHGLEIFNIIRINSKGGSLRVFAQKVGGKRKVESIIQELIQLENHMQLDQVDTFKQFASRLESVKEKLDQILTTLKQQGKSIIGYGASTPMTTVMYHFDLCPYFDFIADDNAIKQGRFSPGHHLPVLPSSEIYQRKPDCIVILAWQYADMIMQKHQAYLEQGGCFIVPIPEVNIYSNQIKFAKIA